MTNERRSLKHLYFWCIVALVIIIALKDYLPFNSWIFFFVFSTSILLIIFVSTYFKEANSKQKIYDFHNKRLQAIIQVLAGFFMFAAFLMSYFTFTTVYQPQIITLNLNCLNELWGYQELTFQIINSGAGLGKFYLKIQSKGLNITPGLIYYGDNFETQEINIRGGESKPISLPIIPKNTYEFETVIYSIDVYQDNRLVDLKTCLYNRTQNRFTRDYYYRLIPLI